MKKLRNRLKMYNKIKKNKLRKLIYNSIIKIHNLININNFIIKLICNMNNSHSQLNNKLLNLQTN
jgi:hypothetical protein